MTMLQRIMTNASLAAMSDADILVELRRSVAAARASTAHVIEVLAEVDARRLYLAQGCSSLFTYCTQVLHLSEHAAYERITAARLARRIPGVLEALRTGDVTLTAVGLLGPHLTPGNVEELLVAARHKSKREIEEIVAAFAPKPDSPASVRKVPVRAAGRRDAGNSGQQRAPAAAASRESINSAHAALPVSGAHSPVRPDVIAPLAPERYKVQFTATRELHDRLRRAQDLLRHSIPDGDIAAVVDRALTLLVEDLERRKLAATPRPRPPQSLTSESRYIPAAVKRIVWARDAGRCTFVGAQGRCTERGFLEFHHLVPFAAGGETSAGNISLRCRAHNQYEAEQFFGPLFAREARACYEMEGLAPDRVSSASRVRSTARHCNVGRLFLIGVSQASEKGAAERPCRACRDETARRSPRPFACSATKPCALPSHARMGRHRPRAAAESWRHSDGPPPTSAACIRTRRSCSHPRRSQAVARRHPDRSSARVR
jgi:hypothetical protein